MQIHELESYQNVTTDEGMRFVLEVRLTDGTTVSSNTIPQQAFKGFYAEALDAIQSKEPLMIWNRSTNRNAELTMVPYDRILRVTYRMVSSAND